MRTIALHHPRVTTVSSRIRAIIASIARKAATSRGPAYRIARMAQNPRVLRSLVLVIPLFAAKRPGSCQSSDRSTSSGNSAHRKLGRARLSIGTNRLRLGLDRNAGGAWGPPRAASLLGRPLSAVRHDPILRNFYTRLRAAGKKPLVALTAVMRKLVVLLNHMLSKPTFKLAVRPN